MIRENPYGIETIYGFKEIKISNADILKYKEPYNILVVSVREYNYKPFTGSLIGSLNRIGIDLKHIADDLEIDWRKDQHIWLSRPIDPLREHSKRIAGIEFTKAESYQKDDQVIKKRMKTFYGMLSAAHYMGYPIRKIVMPVIGTNHGHFDTEMIVRVLKETAEEALKSIPSLMCVHIIEHDVDRYQILSDYFDRIIGRGQDDLTIASLDAGAKKKIKQISRDVRQILQMRKRTQEEESVFLSVIHQLDEITSYPLHNIRFQNRLLAELMANDLIILKGYRDYRKKTLVEQIEYISERMNFSMWTRSYWHIMRELGNEAAHITKKHPNNEDINILFRCSAEVVRVWLQTYLDDDKKTSSIH